MLHKAKSLKGYTLHATDGEIGKVKEFFFDDKHWTVRYLVVDTGNWLEDRQVLISPHALVGIDTDKETIISNLSKKQIEDSPPLESDLPVSRQYENLYYNYYGWPMYWGGASMTGATPVTGVGTMSGVAPIPVVAPLVDPDGSNVVEEDAPNKSLDATLRSSHDVTGHSIQASDGSIGHVDDFIIDDTSWEIRYMVVDNKVLWIGKYVILSPRWIDRISWDKKEVYVNLSRDAIKNSPEYTEKFLVTRDYETSLYDHYNREGYWLDDANDKK